MKVFLCGVKGMCPYVEKKKDGSVFIGEKGNSCILTTEQFEALKEEIAEGHL